MPFSPLELSRATALVRIGVEIEQMPNYLYKYREINEYFDKVLKGSQLWFSSPREFNDPFDCKAKIDSSNTVDEIKHYVAENFQSVSRHIRRQKIAEWIKKPHVYHKHQTRIIDSMIESTGVCCFAGDSTNLLMWSHYAASHTGVCLKFDVSKDPEFFTVPLKVIYSDEYPVYNHLRNAKSLVDKLIRTKSTCWAYEQEMRVVKHMHKGLFRFNKESLVEIVFGCRVKKDEIERVKTLALNSGFSHVTFTACRPKSGEFAFDFIAV